MAVYRGRGRRIWPTVALTLAGLLTGFFVGYLVGGSSHVSLATHLHSLRKGVETITEGLEVLEIHYEKAVKDGRVVNQVDYRGVTDNLETLQNLYRRLGQDLRALSATGASAARENLKRLQDLVAARAPAPEVIMASRKIQDSLRPIVLGDRVHGGRMEEQQ